MSDATEILRLAGCLDDIDQEVAEECLKILPEEGDKISVADLMEAVQRLKKKWQQPLAPRRAEK